MNRTNIELIQNKLDSIRNRADVVDALAGDGRSIPPGWIHTLLEDIGEDAQWLVDTFCVKEEP